MADLSPLDAVRYTMLPHVSTWSLCGAAIIVEAPTGIVYDFGELEDEEGLDSMTGWEGFLLPVTCYSGIKPAGTAEEMMAQVDYVGVDMDRVQPVYDPTRQPDGPNRIPVATSFGPGWFIWYGDRRGLPTVERK